MSNLEKKEQWKIFGNTEYLVSSWGRFYNTKTKSFIKPYIHKSRSNFYWRVNLGKRKYMSHVLVAIHYVPKDCASKTQVEHDDNNTLNPNAWNLRWVTQSENQYCRYEKNKAPKLA